MIGEPLQRAADRRAVHHSSAEAGDRVRQIQHRQRLGAAAANPAEASAQAADRDEKLRPELIDEPSFERDEPRLQQHEDRERDLDRRLLHPQMLLQRRHEQGPTVLEVRYRNHAEDAEEQDEPAVLQKTFVLTASGCACIHR